MEGYLVALAFVLLIAVIYRPVKSFVLNSLDKNIVAVTNELDEALAIKKQAVSDLDSISKKLEEAKQLSADILSQAQVESKRIIQNATESAQFLCTKKIEIASQNLEASHEKLIAEIKEMAIDAAIESVSTEIFHNLDKDSQADILSSSVERLKKSLH